MANPEHREILKRGVKKWNQWRKDYSKVKPDLEMANLSEADLRAADLSEANLSEANLSKAILSEANLSKAILGGADLSRAILSGADLSEAKLSEADLRVADLSGAILSRAILSGADLSRAILSGADLSEAKLSEANLGGANLSEANLSWTDLRAANLSGADLRVADLRVAGLSGANLSEATLSGANLSEANLSEADLSEADLSKSDLREANLSGANLSKSDLREANLSGANLSGANLSGANLSGANLSKAILQNAFLLASRLINANFDGANLTNASLWETQRAGWSIKGVICESIYWDEEGEKLDTFGPGEFERLYSEKTRVQIKYPSGISTLEIATLPALIQHLEASHQGAKLRFESIQDAPGGAVVSLVFDDVDGISPEQIEELRAEIQSEAEQKALFLRQTLEEEKQAVLLLKGEVQALERTVDKLLLNQKPTYYLEQGEINVSEFKTDIKGNFQGAIGDNSQAHHLNYTEIGGQIERSMDLTALASELEVLRQALKKEATTEEHDIVVADVGKAKKAAEAKDSTKLAEYLKSAGKWAFDVATKIGVSLATEAIKQSTGMK